MNYIKINGIWKSISKGFKKENGEWIELNNASSPFLGETIIKNYVDYSSPGMASSSFLAINSLSDLQKANGYTGSIITNSGVTESSEVPPNTSFTKSLYFNGSSFLTLNNYNFGANNFTIEWWEKSTNSSSGTRFMSTYGTSGGTEAGMMIGWWCTAHRMPEIKWTSYNSYSSWNVIGHGSSAGNVDTSGWHHMAYVRNGSNLYVIKDGALINTIAVSTYTMGYNGSLPMCFGRRGSNSANSTCFSGYLCGIRLSNTALYTQFGTYEERVEPDLSLKYKYGGSKELSISSLPLGTLIRIADSDYLNNPVNYEIADINNLVPGGVVLVRKIIYSQEKFGSNPNYPNSKLDNEIKTTIYNEMPQKLRDKTMDVTFNLSGSGDITRKMFALTRTMVGFGNNSGVAEGKALQLYTSDASRVKTFYGSADYWWLSSRYNDSDALKVAPYGTFQPYADPSDFGGVVPAFAISSETLYDATPNTDGSYNLTL